VSLHDTPHLNAARRRARKRTLARRDGARCAYCRIPFTDLRQATIDHVVPISLFYTWAAAHLVLACRSCNDRKADRLPLLLALVLLASADSIGVHPPTSTPTNCDAGRHAGQRPSADLLLLARLAHARESADRSAMETGERTRGHQRVHLVPPRVRGCVHRSSERGCSGTRSTRTRPCNTPTAHPGTARRESA